MKRSKFSEAQIAFSGSAMVGGLARAAAVHTRRGRRAMFLESSFSERLSDLTAEPCALPLHGSIDQQLVDRFQCAVAPR